MGGRGASSWAQQGCAGDASPERGKDTHRPRRRSLGEVKGAAARPMAERRRPRALPHGMSGEARGCCVVSQCLPLWQGLRGGCLSASLHCHLRVLLRGCPASGQSPLLGAGPGGGAVKRSWRVQGLKGGSEERGVHTLHFRDGPTEGGWGSHTAARVGAGQGVGCHPSPKSRWPCCADRQQREPDGPPERAACCWPYVSSVCRGGCCWVRGR